MRNWLKAAVVMTGVALCAPQAARAETLADALIAGYRNSNLLERNQAVLRAADEDAAQALASLRPVISYVLQSGYVKNAQGDGTATSLTLSANYTLYDFGRGKLGTEIAKETPVFSEDGSSLAYAARKGTEWLWVVNGMEGPGYSELTPTSFAFSADGKHHAYVVIPRFRQAALIVDGKMHTEGKWDGIMPWDAAPVFSTDGARLAFVEVNRSEKLMRVNLDGKAGPWHPGIAMHKSPGFGASLSTQILGPITNERARDRRGSLVAHAHRKRVGQDPRTAVRPLSPPQVGQPVSVRTPVLIAISLPSSVPR